MSSASKKRKIEDERRVFQEKWEELYFVTAVRDTTQCLICQQKIAVMKEYNMRRHYEAMQGQSKRRKSETIESSILQTKKFLCQY